MSLSMGEIAQLVTAFASLGALLLSWQNSWKIEEVHKATNSMKDELVKEVREASLAEGLKIGREEQHTND